MRLLVNGIMGLSTLLYPLAVFFGRQHFEPWKIAALLIVLLLVRLAASYSLKHWSTPLLIGGIAYCLFAIWINQLDALLFYPILVNALMLLIFGWSLFSPPSLIERLARLQHPDLPPEGVIYTRRVTQVWCGFFIINGALASVTAFWCSLEVWSLYNGLIAYVLMGVLFAAEYLVRIRTQKHVR
ncbi:hypothetical protein [Candidatus Methylobacter oryzae]|uniref:DNA gyrase subunit B n=1 Tax=Candidatus Methylobacter oryzae TaxID=2497749 RepID=A0ABY3C4K0_9GAMM|nr:hypothetical protein [Candidatus Methylobacter oryzae]TRW89646.1 hypothetical protein EKO24_021565 [Candidatus Methylobacter oryzae]